MRRYKSLTAGIVSALLVAMLAFWFAWISQRPSEAKSRAIAAALLEYQSAFEDPQSSAGTLPAGLRSPTLIESGCGWHEAYVDYRQQVCGVSFKRRFLLLGNTNDATWTLYDISRPEYPYIRWITLKRRLTTVTNSS